MEIDREDAIEIVRTVRENLQRLGVPELHDEIIQRISRHQPSGEPEFDLIEPKRFLGDYLITLTWLLALYNPAVAGQAVQHLQRNVEGGIEGVVVDLDPNPLTGESIAVPLESLVPDYSVIADGMRQVLASLELRYHEQPPAEFDTPEQGFDKESPPL